MTSEFLIRTLKRIYDECQRAQNNNEEENRGKSIVSDFNDLVEKYQEEYPEDEIIQSIDKVGFSGVYGRAHPQDIQKVKQNTLRIADTLGLDTTDFEDPPSSDTITTIHLEQSQSVSQSVDVNVETVVKMIDNFMMAPEVKEELKEIVRDFDEESQKEDPDKSTLLELIDEARDRKFDIALQLGMLGLKRGLDVLGGGANQPPA